MLIRSMFLCFALCVVAGCSDDSTSDMSSNATSNGTTATSNGTTATSNGTTATSNGTTGVTLTGGEALFREPHSDGNTFACNTCHALDEPAADGFTRAGHALGDAAMRPSFKNGQLTEFLDAVNICRTEWMRAPEFTNDDARWGMLRDFLQEQAGTEVAEPLSFEIQEVPDVLEGGDPMEGQEFFNTACAVCHGADAVGTERAPLLVGEFLTADYIAGRVRSSGPTDSNAYNDLTGGRMPFWAADRISDAQLRDVVAFVMANDPMDMTQNELPDDLERQCDSTHPKIGSSGTFVTFAHRVVGTATIVDDCTIEITDFGFDGTGINVQFYAGLEGDFEARGFSMSGDIRRSGGYDGETLFVQLPEDRTLDDLDSISVWCVPVGVSFGDATFL